MMPINVDPDWWRTLFDEVYLITDARTVCDDDVTRGEVEFYARAAEIEAHDRILDLCGGQGRHAAELCRRGIADCTVLDYSDVLLEIGRKKAEQFGFPIAFIQGDARDTKLPENHFDRVLILGNSLGYSHEADADLRILQESLRVLKPGGVLLIDVSDGEAVRRQFSPNAWHEIGDDIVVCRQRSLDGNVLCAREMVISKTNGVIRDRTYGIRLYTPAELTDLVLRAGFNDARRCMNFTRTSSDVDVGCMNHRIVVRAVKNR